MDHWSEVCSVSLLSHWGRAGKLAAGRLHPLAALERERERERGRERYHDGITIRSEITSKNELKMLNWTNLFLIIFILPSSVWFIGQVFYYKRLCIVMTPHGAEGGGGVRDWQETFSLSAGGNTRLALVWVTEGFPRSALHCPPWHWTLGWDELTLNMFVWWLENHYK